MKESQREVVQGILTQVRDLMEFLESNTPLTADKKAIAHNKLESLKTNLETDKNTHYSINETLVNLGIRRGSNPDKSRWFGRLYDAEISLTYGLAHDS